MSISSRYVTGGYSHNLDGEDESNLDYTDYRLGFYRNWLGIAGNYTSFENFQIESSRGFEQSIGAADKDRSDMATEFMSANVYLMPLKLNYRLEEALNPALDKHNGIGFGTIISWTRTTIDTNDGLIPEVWQTEFGQDDEFESGTFETMNLQLVLGATFTLGGLFTSALFALGGGSQTYEYNTADEDRSGRGDALKDNIHLQAGFTSTSFFTALKLEIESPTYLLDNMSFGVESSDLSFISGIRF